MKIFAQWVFKYKGDVTNGQIKNYMKLIHSDCIPKERTEEKLTIKSDNLN